MYTYTYGNKCVDGRGGKCVYKLTHAYIWITKMEMQKGTEDKAATCVSLDFVALLGFCSCLCRVCMISLLPVCVCVFCVLCVLLFKVAEMCLWLYQHTSCLASTFQTCLTRRIIIICARCYRCDWLLSLYTWLIFELFEDQIVGSIKLLESQIVGGCDVKLRWSCKSWWSIFCNFR